MTQLRIEGTGPEPLPELGQWFTPPDLAKELVGLAGALLDDATNRARTLRILEPTAGTGNLVRAIRARAPGAEIHAVEIDAALCDELRLLGGPVHHSDFLEWVGADPQYGRQWDLAVVNPPYDNGNEGPILERLLGCCRRIVTVLPDRSLHGQARYNALWADFEDPGDWYLRQLHFKILRPKFGPTGGMDEINLLDLRHGAPGPCRVRWT